MTFNYKKLHEKFSKIPKMSHEICCARQCHMTQKTEESQMTMKDISPTIQQQIYLRKSETEDKKERNER